MSKLPSKDEILQWISDNPTLTAKRDIAKAFGIKGAARIDLKRILKELEAEGHLQKRRKTYRDSDALPPVSVLKILEPDAQGDLFARAVEWSGDGPEPKILIVSKETDLGAGDRILARLQKVSGEDHDYAARLIRKIQNTAGTVLGIYREGAEGGRIVPINKKENKEWLVCADGTKGAQDGELVEAEQAGPKGRLGLPVARITERLGDPSAPKSVSLIAIHEHGIPDHFPPNVITEAEHARPASKGTREDLTHLPLVTIDPPDARDHDDAVLAISDPNPANKGGFILWVAIADVAHYVRPDSALDREARTRGNSTYFPDRVVPMLPDRLSGDLCSLHEHEVRPAMAVEMVIDANGEKRSHRFTRALMKSHASLSYEEVQTAYDGAPNARCATLMDDVITPLYGAYDALKRARDLRQPLNLDLPERKIKLDDTGRVTSVAFSERFDAHKLIEECMVLANVAAAEELIQKQKPLLFRVHEEPASEKLDALREVVSSAGFSLAKGQVLKSSHLNRLLSQAAGSEHSELINIATLRSMTQAYYHPENLGHFGLSLRSYAHFTSPIRRYADLIVHRALISAHGWGDDGLPPENDLDNTAVHISQTERRSMVAERDTIDRYLASYLSERMGDELEGRISGVQKFGIFIKLDDTGADGLVPVRTIGSEYFVFDPDTQSLMGSNSGTHITLGQRVVVRIKEVTPLSGGLELELLSLDGKTLPRSSHKGTAKRRKISRAKADKVKRKVKRRQR